MWLLFCAQAQRARFAQPVLQFRSSAWAEAACLGILEALCSAQNSAIESLLSCATGIKPTTYQEAPCSLS
jgi:hypothetical protein